MAIAGVWVKPETALSLLTANPSLAASINLPQFWRELKSVER